MAFEGSHCSPSCLITALSYFYPSPVPRITSLSCFGLAGQGWTSFLFCPDISSLGYCSALIRNQPRLVFYARRTLRIFPIYYLTLAFIAIAALRWHWIQSFSVWSTGVDYAMYVLYLQNWLLLIHWMVPGLNILGHFWSLAVEEQFYLLWPWLVWKLPRRFLLPTCIAGVLGSFLLRVILVMQFHPQYWIHSITPTRGSGLLVGSALAVLASEGRLSRRFLGLLAATGLGMLAFIAAVHHVEFANTDSGPYMSTVGHLALPLLFGALIGSSRYFIPGVTQISTSRFLRTLGKYSYGIYVYHVPIYVLILYVMNHKLGIAVPGQVRDAVLCFLVGFALSFAVAWVSFNFLEAKLMSYKDRFKPIFAGRQPELKSKAAQA